MLEWLKEKKMYLLVTGGIAALFLIYFVWNGSSQFDVLEEDELWDVQEEEDEQVEPITIEEEVEVLVDVKGAVNHPGVYKGKENERVKDMIEKAGGLTSDADAKAINFAMKITDEMVLYVPREGEEGFDLVGGGPSEKDGKININNATQAELETLPGIGPAKALAIIEYRESSGPFETIEDLMSVSGFGKKTFDKLAETITVN